MLERLLLICYHLLFKKTNGYYISCHVLFLFQEPLERNDSETNAESLAGPSHVKEGTSGAITSSVFSEHTSTDFMHEFCQWYL